MEVTRIAVLLVGALACGFDLRARRVPNLLTLGAAIVAIAFHTTIGGLSGLAISLGGWAVGVALLLPLFLLGGMGAGDVKLLGALGAWLGPRDTLWVAFFSALAGGALALVVAFTRGYAGQALTNLWWLLGYWRVAGVRPLPELTLEHGRGPRLAYTVPMLAGVLVTVWLR